MLPSARLIAQLTLISAITVLTACGGSSSSSTRGGPTDNPGSGNNGQPESQNHFDQTLTGFDGETVAFTVYAPENPQGKRVPLILHSHGFGLSRAKNFENPNPLESFLTNDISGDVARRAWLEKGFYVISFDQRGFGETTGNITVMDPDIDCRNVSQIIDWAEENLVNLSFEGDDPLIGAVGLSYGGGFQTVCSSVDKRFDAIVPLATWSNLPYSLYANNTPKNIWLDILSVASMGKLEPYLFEAIIGASTTGEIAAETVTRLAGHSPLSFCEGEREDGRTLSTADALFIQGSNDVLFNINEAVENYECWKGQGNEAHLFIQKDGHILPALQTAGRQILFGTEGTLYCDGQVFQTDDLALNFLASKLQGTSAPAIPDVCFSLTAQQSGTSSSEVKRGGSLTSFDETQIIPGGLSNVVDLLTALPLQTVLATLSSLPVEASSTLIAVLTASADPTSLVDYLDDIVNLLPSELLSQLVAKGKFIPLQTVTNDGVLAGIPLAMLNVSGGNGDGNLLYIGLGKIPADGGDAFLINDQVLPIRGSGLIAQEMIGVSEPVTTGDTLGLMVYGFHPYFTHISSITQAPIPAAMSGTVDVPLVVNNSQ
ncbi:CocE/NonD family hydrolase [uncultured Zhongshania sp.]|uniref:alpha/beta hydrolase family protein n=1 Tax=uncultured Zhongshania sp. TaxID=1642288 RepID=UPI0025FFD0B9|nr:CocE/NonD family hydrolase [uncultured Zhongshania sp.]